MRTPKRPHFVTFSSWIRKLIPGAGKYERSRSIYYWYFGGNPLRYRPQSIINSIRGWGDRIIVFNHSEDCFRGKPSHRPHSATSGAMPARTVARSHAAAAARDGLGGSDRTKAHPAAATPAAAPSPPAAPRSRQSSAQVRPHRNHHGRGDSRSLWRGRGLRQPIVNRDPCRPCFGYQFIHRHQGWANCRKSP